MGISFIGRAYSLVDVGQKEAISSYVTRPIKWAPAAHTESRTQRLMPSSSLSTPHECDLSSAATYPSIEMPV